MFQKQFDQYPLDSTIEIAKARGKQMIYHSAAALGLWDYMIARRSRVPNAVDHQQYQKAWQTSLKLRLDIPSRFNHPATPNPNDNSYNSMTTAAVHQRIVSPDGQTVLPFAPWPYFEGDEIEAAAAVLRSGKVNYWTGQEGRLFEAEFAQSIGTKYAICLANGTVALELALQALGIGRGHEVITTSRTFIASASCVVMRGARPVCVDVDPESQNITAETIRRAITPRTKAIIAVHLAGWPCDMDPILELAAEYRTICN